MLKKLLNTILLLFALYGQAQVNFEAVVGKKTLGVNERLRIDFKMNKDGDDFTPPTFKDFRVVGGPSQSINNSWINGVRSFSKSYTYYLAPKKRGDFKIGQASIVIEGDVYKTTPINIKVTAAVSAPRDPNDPSTVVGENIHLVAEVSNDSPYLNQAISVVYKLYVLENTAVRNWREIDSPRFDDFWSQNMDVSKETAKNGSYKGKNGRYIVLKKVVLYPQKTGELKIEALSLDVAVDVPTSRRDIFGGRVNTTVNTTISSPNRKIRVKPLPEDGRPENFSGAVGNFQFEIQTNKKSLEVSEALQVIAKVKGVGNLKLFKIPKPNMPGNLEVYEPEHNEKINTTLKGMNGFIADNFTVVPNVPGKYPIPSVAFSFFDPISKKYKTLFSEELLIDVKGGVGIVGTSTQNNKQQVQTSSKLFSSFKSATELEKISESPFFRSNLFWFLMSVPLFMVPLLLIVRKRLELKALDVVGNRVKATNRLAKRHLGSAKKHIGKKELFYNALESALLNYLKSKLVLETSEITKENVSVLLKKKAVDRAPRKEFLKLLETCELARYTPLSNVEMQKDYETAKSVLSAIEKQIKRK